MKEFCGTKLVAAKPMSRGEYNDYRGWELPADEFPEDEGYLVEYRNGGKPNFAGHDGYISWSPKEQFDEEYQATDAMSFGHAVEALKAGKKVVRAGWNGKGMWLYLEPANNYAAQTDAAKEYWADKGTGTHVSGAPLVPYQAYIAMKTAQESVVPWLASQSDVLANDWQIVE